MQTARKLRKRKQIQKGGTLEYRARAELSITRSSSNNLVKKARTKDDRVGPQRAARRYSNYKETGHNKITYRKRPDDPEESEASTYYIASLIDSDGSDDE